MTTQTSDITNLPASNHTALIIGDAMVDTYMDSRPVGISDEAPIMVLDWVRTTRTFGGMLNTAKSLAALGFEVHAVGLINQNDDPGQFIHEECTRLGIREHWHSDGRPTIEKARVRTDPNDPPIEQIARIDVEDDEPLGHQPASVIRGIIDSLLPDADVVLISDYIKGALTRELAVHLVNECKARNIPLLVDAKPTTLAWYAGASIIKPNECEAREFLARADNSETPATELDHQTLALRVSGRLNASTLLTCAGDGMYLVDRTPDMSASQPGPVHIAPPVVDIVESTSGAGDVVMAAMACAKVRGQNWNVAAELARHAVAITIERGGTCALEPHDDLWSIFR